MRVLAALLLSCLFASGATYTEGYFGFDASAADNWDAMKSLESHFASGGDGDTITFTNGTYTIVAQSALAVGISGRTGFTVNGPGAWFREVTYNTTSTYPNRHFFRLTSCTNATVIANYESRQHGYRVTNSFAGIRLLSGNSNIVVRGMGTNLWEFIRIGDYNSGSSTTTAAQYDISVITTNWNCDYGVVSYLVNNLNVTNYSEGIEAGGYALGRATYSQAVTNAVIYSRSKNSSKTSHVNLLTSGGYGGDHYGCDNVFMTAIDVGSTHHGASGSEYQTITGIATQADTGDVWDTKPVTHKNITLNVDLTASSTIWTNRRVIEFSTQNDTNLNARFENVTITGEVRNTAPSNAYNQRTVDAGTLSTGLKYLGLAFENFDDDRTYGDSFYISSPNAEAEITACSSTLFDTYLAYPAYQTFTDLGECETDPPIIEPGTRSTLRGRANLSGWWE